MPLRTHADCLSGLRLCLAVAGLLVFWPGGALARPQTPAPTPDGEPPTEALIGEIPFHASTPLSRVLLDLAPEGRKPFLLMLDTGASTSIITPRMARNLGVNVRPHKSSPYRQRTRLGRDLLFWVDTRASDTGVQGGSFEFGVLGSDFLDDYVLEIDYPRRVVRFWDAKAYSIPETHPSPDVHVLPFKRSGTRIVVPVELDGHDFHALFDTGAPFVLVSKKNAKAAGVSKEALLETVPIGYVLGDAQSRVYEPESLRLGGVEVPPTPILIESKSPMNVPGGAIVGYDAFGPFKVRIDYKRKRISLSKPADPPTFINALDTYRRDLREAGQ